MKVLLLFLGQAIGSEWVTSGGDHCIEKCKIGRRGEVEEVFWCPVVDGVTLEHKPFASSRPGAHDTSIGEEDKERWDYCTPAALAGITEEDYQDKVTLPARVNRTRRQTGSGGNFNPGTNVLVESSLPGVTCHGPCTKQSDGKTQCDVGQEGRETFFCSPAVALERKQLSSHNRVWCTGPCYKEQGEEHYKCRTLYGEDLCSPAGDRSSTGTACTSACSLIGEVYQCHTDEVMTNKEDCGLWSHHKANKKTLEYTVDNQVCASPCEEVDGNLMCSYVEWDWESDLKMAELKLKSGSCDHTYKEGSNLTVVWIVVGCLVVVVVVIVVVAVVVKKRQYSAAPTQDNL